MHWFSLSRIRRPLIWLFLPITFLVGGPNSACHCSPPASRTGTLPASSHRCCQRVADTSSACRHCRDSSQDQLRSGASVPAEDCHCEQISQQALLAKDCMIDSHESPKQTLVAFMLAGCLLNAAKLNPVEPSPHPPLMDRTIMYLCLTI